MALLLLISLKANTSDMDYILYLNSLFSQVFLNHLDSLDCFMFMAFAYFLLTDIQIA